ncbi:glutamic acid-rich protein [Diachasma alloeum]|uniref:glutamic acid-rich protein n=1 Tax=Diachasma alloeum TaxID=454923 RepID=UPI0007385101|nr:glutamic acid-rich protein [Diachasma alloeum]
MKVRTAQEMEEERVRTLYIRLPHTIKNIDEIRDLIFGDVDIKLPRQSGRHCHVVFPSVEEKLKNMKALKKKLIDNKHIFVSNAKLQDPDVKKEKQMKMKKVKPVVIRKPKEQTKVTKICFLHKIPKSATVKDLKKLFPEAKNVAILYKQRLQDNVNFDGRTGIVKFRDVKTAAAYLNKERPMPVCKGVQLEIHRDKRRQKNKKKNKAETLKVYDDVKTDVKDEEEVKSVPEDEEEVESVPEDEEEVESEPEDEEEEEDGDDEDANESSDEEE